MNQPRPEILTPLQMYEADRLAANAGISSLELMQNAGRAVVTEIVKRYKKCPVAVLCGPGNNGGDGFVVARLLAAKKWPVRAYLIGEPSKLRGDAAVMAKKLNGKFGTFDDFAKNMGGKTGPQLIVDAIFGAGLSRDLPGMIADTIHGAGVPVVAIDVPSGVDGLTAQQRQCSVIADLTVTFFRKKPAHVLQPGRRLCGEIVVADIGIPDAVADALPIRVYENAKPYLPDFHADDHKFRRGHGLIWSGPALNTGASRLAAWGAARMGAGLTSICGTRDALAVHAHHVSSIMLKPAENLEEWQSVLADKRLTTICMGPAAGVSEQLCLAVLAALATDIPVVLDADALTAFADAPERLFAAIKTMAQRAVVLTPHEGEFASLFKRLPGTLENKIERAQAAAKLSGAIVVLKGADTVIANPAGFAWVNTNGTPKLATAGSGDVLAGMITGLLAQGMDESGAASAGVWLHADAANRIDRRSLIAEDLIEALGR